MRELLEAVAAGEVSVETAETRLRGYTRGPGGRFDVARETRSGVPEAVLAEGKTPAETAALVESALEAVDRVLVTRADREAVAAVRRAVEETFPDHGLVLDERAGALVVRAPDYEPPHLDADVTIVTGGTSDAGPAGEAAAVVREMGARVRRIEDVGVAGLHRVLDELDRIREADVLVVAAGREGALPTVLAGLVDAPLIGLPISTGYGHAGAGEAALSGMLQSCTALTVVNVDAGFTAGAQAGLIARAIDRGRGEDDRRRDDDD